MRIRTILSVSILSVGLHSVVFANSNDGGRESAERYLQHAQVVADELTRPAPQTQVVNESIGAMLEEAKVVLGAFAQLHTQCTEQLVKVIELYPQIAVWTVQEIRRNIEGGLALPKAEGCYAARDVVAHAAIVRALSRDAVPSLKARAEKELGEAVEHMQEIAAELKD